VAEPVAAVPTEVAVREILAALDGEGRWLSRYEGEMLVGQPKFALGEAYVASAVFVERVETLCLFLSQ
jgi:hypothetical protein